MGFTCASHSFAALDEHRFPLVRFVQAFKLRAESRFTNEQRAGLIEQRQHIAATRAAIVFSDPQFHMQLGNDAFRFRKCEPDASVEKIMPIIGDDQFAMAHDACFVFNSGEFLFGRVNEAETDVSFASQAI